MEEHSFSFRFSFPDLAGLFVCADGHSYRITAEDQADDDECFIQEDVFGYLVRVADETIGIASGICPLSGCNLPPTIDLVPDCKELEQPMIKFIHGFTNIPQPSEPRSNCHQFVSNLLSRYIGGVFFWINQAN